MSKDLSDYRKTYKKQDLLEDNCPDNPLTLFHKWFTTADNTNTVEEANAMTISTIETDGFPKSRVVLLKKFDENGFVFFTNYNSEKGKAILNNENVCLSFFWPALEQQVIIKGMAEKTSESQSDDYFKLRPTGSKLGAWASNQSEVITSREDLQQSLQKFTEEFKNKEINRPKHWGGIVVKPISIEFWQGRPNRLHDRIRYSLINASSWKIERLAP